MTEVTRILDAIEQGEPHAANQLLPLVYEELRKLAAQRLAQERPGRRFRRRPWFMKPIATASGYRGRWGIRIWDATQWDAKRDAR